MGTLTAGTVKDLYRQLLLARSQRPWRRISPTLSSSQRRNLRFPTLARTEGIDRPTLVNVRSSRLRPSFGYSQGCGHKGVNSDFTHRHSYGVSMIGKHANASFGKGDHHDIALGLPSPIRSRMM